MFSTGIGGKRLYPAKTLVSLPKKFKPRLKAVLKPREQGCNEGMSDV